MNQILVILHHVVLEQLVVHLKLEADIKIPYADAKLV
jgi:hypothetical protein